MLHCKCGRWFFFCFFPFRYYYYFHFVLLESSNFYCLFAWLELWKILSLVKCSFFFHSCMKQGFETLFYIGQCENRNSRSFFLSIFPFFLLRFVGNCVSLFYFFPYVTYTDSSAVVIFFSVNATWFNVCMSIFLLLLFARVAFSLMGFESGLVGCRSLFHMCLFNSLLMGFDLLNVIIIYIICCLFLHFIEKYRSNEQWKRIKHAHTTFTPYLFWQTMWKWKFLRTQNIYIYMIAITLYAKQRKMPSINTPVKLFFFSSFFTSGCAFICVSLFVSNGKCHWNGLGWKINGSSWISFSIAIWWANHVENVTGMFVWMVYSISCFVSFIQVEHRTTDIERRIIFQMVHF